MAVFVLAIALTGMMRLHLTALRAQRQSSYQTTAAHLAGDMAEIIRTWAAPGSDTPFLFDYKAGDTPPMETAADCIGGAICDPAALRRFGVAQWLEIVDTALPMARVSICRDAAPWDAAGAFGWACSGGAAGIVIKLGWRAEAGGGDDNNDSSNGPQLVLNIGEPE
jgi:type IV pilus assembly protein PilV